MDAQSGNPVGDANQNQDGARQMFIVQRSVPILHFRESSANLRHPAPGLGAAPESRTGSEGWTGVGFRMQKKNDPRQWLVEALPHGFFGMEPRRFRPLHPLCNSLMVPGHGLEP